MKLAKSLPKRMHTKFAQMYSLKCIVRSNVLSPMENSVKPENPNDLYLHCLKTNNRIYLGPVVFYCLFGTSAEYTRKA